MAEVAGLRRRFELYVNLSSSEKRIPFMLKINTSKLRTVSLLSNWAMSLTVHEK